MTRILMKYPVLLYLLIGSFPMVLYPQVTVVNDCGQIGDGYCSSIGGGNCYYIDPENGSDDNPGTFNEPWRTMVNINRSIYGRYRPSTWVGLSPGDVLYLMEGVHDSIYHPGDDTGADGGGSFIIYFRGLHGTEELPITIRNYPGHHAILDPEGNGRGIFVYQSSHINIRGLEIRNAYGRGFRLAQSHNIVASNLLIGNTDGPAADNIAGMEIHSSSEVEIYNSIFYDNYDRTAAENNAQTSNSGNMVLFSNHGFISIHNNIFFQTGDSYGQYSGFGIKYKHSSRDPESLFELYANYFENHKYAHIFVGTHNANIRHNIINSGSGTGIASRDLGGTTHQQYQKFFNNTIYGTTGFFMRPTLNWINHDNGPWDDVTNNAFYNNIVYDLNENYHQEQRTVLLSPYMGDELYLKLKDGIDFDSNCYYNPHRAVSFGFGGAGGSFGELGGFYDLTGWREEYGWDINSYETDPLFIDASIKNFTATASECAGMGALTNGYNISTEKIFHILCADEISTSIKSIHSIPSDTYLMQNYPNPFNQTTVIRYRLNSSGHVKLTISDIMGREIKTLVDDVKSSGTYAVYWDGTDLRGNIVPSGTYFYFMRNTDGSIISKKMILIK